MLLTPETFADIPNGYSLVNDNETTRLEVIPNWGNHAYAQVRVTTNSATVTHVYNGVENLRMDLEAWNNLAAQQSLTANGWVLFQPV